MEFATILQPDGSSQYQCNVCHHVFRKKGSLAEHQRFICGQDPQFGCPHCPYKTKLKSNLKKHMVRLEKPNFLLIHDTDGSLLYKCLYCQRSYKHKHTLWRHQRYECGKEPQFACPHCPYKAKLKGNLSKHIYGQHFADTLERDATSADKYTVVPQSDGGKNYSCNTCGRSYKHYSAIYTHLRFECGKDPQFSCPHCPYRAKQKGNLRKHALLKHFKVLP
ncbi:hypothetical protein J6590_014734 [Homalodisca vitripennis]|nr:hypothetical protein J6590_014734 [Homalodisca vitripennis]